MNSTGGTRDLYIGWRKGRAGGGDETAGCENNIFGIVEVPISQLVIAERERVNKDKLRIAIEPTIKN